MEGKTNQKGEDCYFYYYSIAGCTRRDCWFRHEPAAKGSEKECQDWLKNGSCPKTRCPLKHMVLKKDRSQIQCYHESKDQGCLKLDCPFQHKFRQPLPTNMASTDQHCVVCDVSCPVKVFSQHLSGKGHLKKLAELEEKSAKKGGLQASKGPPSKEKSKQPNEQQCFVCKVSVPTQSFNLHLNGKAHQKKLADLGSDTRARMGSQANGGSLGNSHIPGKDPRSVRQPGPVSSGPQKPGLTSSKEDRGRPAAKNTPDPSLFCKMCDHSAENKFYYDQHMNSQEHRTKVDWLEKKRQKKDFAERKGLWCQKCGFSAESKFFYDKHMNSQEHRNKVDLLPKNQSNAKSGGQSPVKRNSKEGYGRSKSVDRRNNAGYNVKSLMEIPLDVNTAQLQNNAPIPGGKKAISKNAPPSAKKNMMDSSIKHDSANASQTQKNEDGAKNNATLRQSDISTFTGNGTQSIVTPSQNERPNEVVFFWDVENCPLPKGVTCPLFIQFIRDKFIISSKGKEVTFVAAFDGFKHRDLANSLQRCGVNFISSIPGKKDSADAMLRKAMRKEMDRMKGNCTVVLISGDVDFSEDLYQFRYGKRHEVVLIHNQQATAELKSLASSCFLMPDLCEQMKRQMNEGSKVEVENKNTATAEKPTKADTEPNEALEKSNASKTKHVSDLQSENEKEKIDGGKNIYILWDLLSRPPPEGILPVNAVMMIRNYFFKRSDNLEAGFAIYCGNEETLSEDLRIVGVNSTTHLSNQSIEDLLKKAARPPTTVVLVANGTHVVDVIRFLRYDKKMEVVLMHDNSVAEVLKYVVDSCLNFEEVVKERKDCTIA